MWRGSGRTLAGLPLPRTADGWIVLAADISNWLRPDAATSAERLFCHTYGRGRGSAQMILPQPSAGGTPRLAVLDRRRPGVGPHVLDRPAGRGPPRAGRR